MDALAGLLDGPRARGAFLLRMVMEPPWSVHVDDHAPLTVVVVARGEAWITPEHGDPVCVRPGDVALLRGPEPYTFAAAQDSPPHAFIDEHQHCTTVDGSSLVESMDLGVRTWGNDPEGSVELLVGTYLLPGEVSQRVLRTLPNLIVLPESEWDGALTPLLLDEITRDRPGQEAVLDRLLDLLVVGVLRTWLARPDTGAPGWYRAQSDPIVGKAIGLIHHRPTHPWTVASLAHEVGLSRAAFARRFQALVGEPPMAFLTGWRLTLAADLLHEPGSTVESVAHAVGYGTPFALSAAFKRVRGVSPAEYRLRSRAGAHA